MNEKKKSKRSKGGRIPKDDPANIRHIFYLNQVDEAKFLALFEQSGLTAKAHFITACIFNRPMKVIQIDRNTRDYYMRLTTFFGQFRGIATNYNQIVKALNTNFTEKKALAFLYKLEKATLELVEIHKQVIELTKEFEAKYLNNGC